MSCIETKVENSRKQMGCLKINNKSYPIYEGLNVIGRDFKAAVLLKNLTSSKHHAIISVVDENTHLISDFDSSNGTKLRNIQLVPYKFYKLDSREAIIFGDIVGIYHKCDELQNESINNNAYTELPKSQSVDYLASTQILQTEVDNVHDLPTQIYMNESQKNNESAIHDAETQKISQNNQNKEVESDVSSEATEEYEVDKAIAEHSVKLTSNEEDNHVDITSSELYVDVFANETLQSSLENSKYNIAVDETVITENKLDKSTTNNEKNAFSDEDDIILNTQDNAIIEKKASELLSKGENNTDSETDIEEEFDKNVLQNKTEIKSTPDKQQNGEDDSETDVEDDQLFIEKMKVKVTHSTLETNVENDALRNITLTTPIDLSKINDNKIEADACDNDEEELDLLASKEKSSDNIDKFDSDDDIDLLVPTQLLELENKNNVNTSNENKLESNIPASNTDSFVVPKQMPALKTKLIDISQNVENELSQAKTNSLVIGNKNMPLNDNYDDDLPTQLLESKISEKVETIEDAPTQILEPKRNTVKELNNDDDDDDLPPTQLLSTIINEKNMYKDEPIQALREEKSLVEVNKNILLNDDVDDDLPPTQLLPSKINEKNDQIEDVFLAPTQILGSNINSNQNESLNKSEENIFSMPTQLLGSNINSNQNEALNKSEENIFSMATQLLENNKSPDVYSAPTQKLIKNKKSVNFSEDVYLMDTQKLAENQNEIIDDVFMAPTQLLTENCNKNDVNNSSSNNIDGVALHNNSEESIDNSMRLVLDETEDDISDCKNSKQSNTEKRNCEPETQLEVDFALETQKLYVEEKTSRPNNPLANMFDEENTEMTEQIFEKPVETPNTKNEQIKNTSNIPTRQGLRNQNKNITTVASTSALKKINIDSSETSDEERVCADNKNKISQNLKSVNTDDFQSLRVNLLDLKHKSKTKNKNTSSSDESDFEISSRPKRRNQSKYDKKVDHIPNVVNIKSNKKASIEKEMKTPINVEDNISTRPHNTRGKRISYQQLNSGKKVTPKGKSAAKQEQVEKYNSKEVKKSARIKQKSIQKDAKQENFSDLDDFVSSRTTRKSNKRTHSKVHAKNEEKDSDSADSNINLPTKKKISKLQYTDESEPASNSSSSSNTIVRSMRTPKRSMKIEDSSSDENVITNPSSSSCLHTPKTKRKKYEPLSITPRARAKPKVVFTMLNDEELNNAVKKLGGNVVDSMNSCTVLVTDKISRSLKFLSAIALGIPIVHSKWIRDSLKKSLFQDPWDYLLKDPESEAKFNFKLEESFKKSTEKKLLNDYTVLLATTKNFEVLKEIIETSGGKCVTRIPAKSGKAIVVSYEEDKAKYSKYLKQKSLTVVSAEAIFSGILKQELDWNQHLLS